MKVAFWNTYGNEHIDSYLCSLVLDNKLDIIVMAEYKGDENQLLNNLLMNNLIFKKMETNGCTRICAYSVFKNVKPGQQAPYYSIQILNNKYIFCFVHLPSDLSGSRSDERYLKSTQIIEDIQKYEQKYGKEHTIIVGDFNDMPYSSMCLAANAFHGLSYCEPRIEQRKVYGDYYQIYYNPMWNLFGDFSFPPGTYYYKDNSLTTPIWFMFDQVIISPKLKSNFVQKELKIITKTTYGDLATRNGHPNKKISDHFPIVFEIREENYEIRSNAR